MRRVRLILVSVLVAFMAACSADDDFRKEVDAGLGSYYLTIQINLSSDGTRADDGTESSEHPEDEDENDGQISGTSDENQINDITFFFVDINCQEANNKTTLFDLSQEDLPFVAAIYIDKDHPEKLPHGAIYDSNSATLKIKIENGKTISDRYAITAVANMGDLSAGNRGIENIFTDSGKVNAPSSSESAEEITSLHKLRKHLVTNVWDNKSSDGTAADNFRMSAINLSGGGVLFPVKVSGDNIDGSEKNPFSAECDLMRLAARIDLGCNESEETNDVKYGNIIIDDDGIKEIVYGAYETHVADGSSAETETRIGTVYLTGIEIFNRFKEDTGNVYTLRHTVSKEIAESWQSATTNLSACQNGMECGGLLKRTTNDKKTELYYVADPYFTMKKTDTPEDSNTSGYYDNPYSLLWEKIKNNSGAFTTHMSKYTKHFTDTYDISRGFNRTLIIGYVKENSYDNSRLDPETTETFNTLANTNYATGLALKTVFVPEKVYTDAKCTEAQAITNFTRGTTFHMWRGTDSDNYQKSVFFSTLKAADDYKTIMKNGNVHSYEHGIGYHELFIEHADKSAPAKSVMKHGIVRNNVYRVLLTFRGPGKTNYTEEIQDAEWHIYTRNWNLRNWNMIEEPEITL